MPEIIQCDVPPYSTTSYGVGVSSPGEGHNRRDRAIMARLKKFAKCARRADFSSLALMSTRLVSSPIS